MNAEEVTRIAYFVKRAVPHQGIDQETPAAWAPLLSDIRYEDAQRAVVEILKAQQYVAPADIRRAVRSVRAKRLEVHPPVNPPPGLTFPEEQAWRREINRRIGDGELIDVDAEYAALGRKTRQMPEIEMRKEA